jgi:hypothetical protein
MVLATTLISPPLIQAVAKRDPRWAELMANAAGKLQLKTTS